MPIRFDCPSCKTNYEVADDLGGKMIMCRACKKRGPVRGLTATTQPAMVSSGAPSRRRFLLIGSFAAASLGAIASGAVLAQWRPWRHWGDEDPEERRRRRGGRPRSGDAPDRPAPERKEQDKGTGV